MNDQLRHAQEQKDADRLGRIIMWILIGVLIVGILIGVFVSKCIF